jgi:hypothetical protein
MSSVYDLHLRSTSLSNPSSDQAPENPGQARPGETSGERRLRLLRTVLGDVRGPTADR